MASAQRSNPWMTASKSIAQDTGFVASQINLNRIFLFKLYQFSQIVTKTTSRATVQS